MTDGDGKILMTWSKNIGGFFSTSTLSFSLKNCKTLKQAKEQTPNETPISQNGTSKTSTRLHPTCNETMKEPGVLDKHIK